jgi:hypothetical protein
MFALTRKFFERLDGLAGVNDECAVVKWLERFAFVFLVLTFAAAPHSIAATQSARAGLLFKLKEQELC